MSPKSYLDTAQARGLLPMFYLELASGLRKGELVALLWSDLGVQNKTSSVSKQYIKSPNGELILSRPKTETSVRKISIPQTEETYYPDSVVNLHKKILKDAGFTLHTYTHATKQKRDEAAQPMDSFMEQVM